MIVTTELEQAIYDIAAPVLTGMGYEIIRIQFAPMHGKQTLQIMIDKTDGKAVGLDDCEAVSRSLSALMDVEDPIDCEYHLEVSSAGLDRPLTRIEDFERYKDFEVRMKLKQPLDGAKKYSGVLLGVDEDGNIRLAPYEGKEEVVLEFSLLESAKLIITDALLAANDNRT